jgi:hypothetical protein
LPEEQLYGLSRLPHDEALKKFEQIVAGQNNSENQQASIDAITPVAPGTKRHFALMTRSIKGAGHGKHKQNAQALKTLRELRIWLEDQESRILKYLE